MEQCIIIDRYILIWQPSCSKGNKIPMKYNAMVASSPVPLFSCAVMCVT